MTLLYDNKYQYIKDLGEGGFGKVFLAKEKVSNRDVAIKQLKNADKAEQENIIHEIGIISKFENPNIVAYYHHFFQDDQLFLVESNEPDGKVGSIQKTIIKFGRQNYEVNDVQVSGGSAISRRHSLIVNCKDDVWLYDLDSTGTYLNGERIQNKAPMNGLNKIKIGKAEYIITTDKSKLL